MLFEGQNLGPENSWKSACSIEVRDDGSMVVPAEVAKRFGVDPGARLRIRGLSVIHPSGKAVWATDLKLSSLRAGKRQGTGTGGGSWIFTSTRPQRLSALAPLSTYFCPMLQRHWGQNALFPQMPHLQTRSGEIELKTSILGRRNQRLYCLWEIRHPICC